MVKNPGFSPFHQGRIWQDFRAVSSVQREGYLTCAATLEARQMAYYVCVRFIDVYGRYNELDNYSEWGL